MGKHAALTFYSSKALAHVTKVLAKALAPESAV